MASVRALLPGVFLVLLSWASAAQAQTQTQPHIDLVLWPLTAQAEADLRAGKPVLARARAEIVVRMAPSQAPGAVRARAVYDRTAGAVGAPPPVDVVWEPMLRQAEADLAAGETALAAARADAIVRNVPPESPLALRAAEIHRTVAGAPPAGLPSAPPGYTPTGVAGAPAGYTPANAAAQPPPAEVDETRRRGSEMVELYIWGSALGLYTGLELLVALGVDDDDAQLLGTIPLLTGVGGALLVYGLDSGEGMRRGQPVAISTGIALGLGEGLLTYGAFHRDLSVRDGFALTWGTTFAGAIAGAGAAFLLEPPIAHSRFVTSGALWGAAILGLIAIGANPDDTQHGFRMVLGGFNGGLLLTALLAGPVDMDGGRVMLLNVGFFGGAAVGATVPLIILGARDDDDVPPGTIATTVGVGAAAGLTLVFILTQGSGAGGDPATPADPAAQESPSAELAPLVAPVEGGGVLGLTGRF